MVILITYYDNPLLSARENWWNSKWTNLRTRNIARYTIKHRHDNRQAPLLLLVSLKDKSHK